MSQLFYRTKDGQSDYGFSFERQVDDSYRAYITSQPDYQGRNTSAEATHRLRDRQGRHFICWTEPLRTEQQARRVAASWADCTQEYIKSGRFADPSLRNE